MDDYTEAEKEMLQDLGYFPVFVEDLKEDMQIAWLRRRSLQDARAEGREYMDDREILTFATLRNVKVEWSPQMGDPDNPYDDGDPYHTFTKAFAVDDNSGVHHYLGYGRGWWVYVKLDAHDPVALKYATREVELPVSDSAAWYSDRTS